MHEVQVAKASWDERLRLISYSNAECGNDVQTGGLPGHRTDHQDSQKDRTGVVWDLLVSLIT